MLLDIVLGIVGAVVGGFISSSLGMGGVSAWYNPYSIVIAVVGAVIVLLGYRAVTGTSRL